MQAVKQQNSPLSLWSRAKHFAILGTVILGFVIAIVGMYLGMHAWLWFSLGVVVRIEHLLPSWLVPTVAIGFGLTAAALLARSAFSKEPGRWRWLVIAFVPFWALQGIAWLAGVLLGLLLFLPLLPFALWDEKQKAKVAKMQHLAFQKGQEMRERERSEYMAAIRQQIADKHAAEQKWREEAPVRAEQARLRSLERSRARRAGEKEAEQIRRADRAMKNQLYAEIYRSEGFSSRASRTQEARLRVVSPETRVSPPSVTLPVGDYAGYVETIVFDGEGVQNLKLVMLFLDEVTIGKLGLSEHQRPIKFEVLQHVRSGAIQLI